jgi:hypothetical protein
MQILPKPTLGARAEPRSSLSTRVLTVCREREKPKKENMGVVGRTGLRDRVGYYDPHQSTPHLGT